MASVAATASDKQPRSMARPSYQALRTSSLGQPGQGGLLAGQKGGHGHGHGHGHAGHRRVPGGPRKRQTIKTADGETKVKDLTKGWARCVKKFNGYLHGITDKIHDWFGMDYNGDWWAPALTIENLEDAVRDPDVDQVERLINNGVHPNEPIDEYGHTVLDALAVEQLQMIIDCQEQKASGISAAHLTQMFIDHEDAFF